jgi:hypothetical protein
MSQTSYFEDVLQTGGCLDLDCDSDGEEEHIPYLFALAPLKPRVRDLKEKEKEKEEMVPEKDKRQPIVCVSDEKETKKVS